MFRDDVPIWAIVIILCIPASMILPVLIMLWMIVIREVKQFIRDMKKGEF